MALNVVVVDVLLTSRSPKVATLEVPEVEGIDNMQLRVLMDKLGQPLWVELSIGNLAYFRDVVSRQIASGQIKRNHPRDQVPETDRVISDVKGVSFSYKRQSFCARVRQDDQVVQRYFRVGEVVCVGERQRDAEAWVAEQAAPADMPVLADAP